MGCQKAVAQRIVDKGADYALQMKANHPLVHEEVVSYFKSEIGNSLRPTSATFQDTAIAKSGRRGGSQ